ncbi:MAG: N-acetylglucosamine-6-phosphate deacetylase [Thermoanaerobaculia bacterium]
MSEGAKNLPSSPGLVDLHIHGAFGVDVLTASAAELDRLALALSGRGISHFLPTLVPQPLDAMAATVERVSAWMRSRRAGDGRGAMPLGIHFEGPFVSAARCGALHRSYFLDGSDPSTLDAFFEALGDPPGRSMTTLAPEIPGGIAVVNAFKKRGFVISIGHTEAGASTLEAAREAGASHMTHFGNAMRPLHHRDVGPIGWGLATDGITVDLVADLRHLAPEMLRLVLKVKGEGRVALVSDAMPAAGLGDGAYVVWGETLTVKDGDARNAAGALAGSTCLLDECVTRLASIGVPKDAAYRMATDVPRAVFLS